MVLSTLVMTCEFTWFSVVVFSSLATVFIDRIAVSYSSTIYGIVACLFAL